MKTDRIYQMSPSHSSFTGTTTTAKSRWVSPSSVAGLLIATTSGVPLVVSPRRAGYHGRGNETSRAGDIVALLVAEATGVHPNRRSEQPIQAVEKL
uniref:Uncharacterized protein n=1 Tax=Oryza nivara TaxID=4536 RepID=A0A0E0GXZ1_ORYNI